MTMLQGNLAPKNDIIEEDIEECFHCHANNIISDNEHGEMVCGNCAAVLAEKTESVDELNHDYREKLDSSIHCGLPSSLAHHDRFLSTTISFSNTDAHGVPLNVHQRSQVYRMRRWNQISDSNRSYHRNLKNAFAAMMRIKDKLSLSDPVTEKSAYYYRKVLDLNVIKGRSIKGFVVACVYTACREMNVPRTIDEIAKVADADNRFAGKCYRLLVRYLNLRLPPSDIVSHLASIANNAQVSERTLRKAIEMMSTIKENHISSGKVPNALAVAVLYAACVDQGERVKQTAIASAGKTSMVTLRKRFIDVRKLFPHIPASLNDDP